MTNPVARPWSISGYNSDGKEYTEENILTYCPGCLTAHPFTINSGGSVRNDGTPRPTWTWDGNLETPTFSPSMLVYSSVHICKDRHVVTSCANPDSCGSKSHLITNYREVEDQNDWVYGHDSGHPEDVTQPFGNCHSFLQNGMWQFLGDSAHGLAGQTVPMIPLPDYLMKRGF